MSTGETVGVPDREPLNPTRLEKILFGLGVVAAVGGVLYAADGHLLVGSGIAVAGGFLAHKTQGEHPAGPYDNFVPGDS